MKIKVILFIIILKIFFNNILYPLKINSNIILKEINYPWWNELSLTTKIILIFNKKELKEITSKNIKKFYGKITLYYLINKFKEIDFYINFEKKYYSTFYTKIEPLNNAFQNILPGIYKVKIKIKILEKNEIIEKNFFIKTPKLFKYYKKKYREFYIKIMKSLNEKFRKLRIKKLENLRKKNMFDEKKWWKWIKKEYFFPIKKIREKLKLHKKKNLCLIYPITYDRMFYYTGLLERIGYIESFNLFKFYNSRYTNYLKKFIDPLAIRNMNSIINTIKELHGKCAVELRISLKKELGYLPPLY